jgi:monoamine oxidase
LKKPVELGAEFVHGDLPLTLGLLENAGIKKHETAGEIWECNNGVVKLQQDFIKDYDNLIQKLHLPNHDITIAHFIKQNLTGKQFAKLRLSLKSYVEGYLAGNIEKASTFLLREELSGGEEKNYRVDGGYQSVTAYLEKQCREKGVRLYLSQEVKEVRWKACDIEVITNHQSFYGKKVLITVSIGVLQSEKIHFSPALPDKIVAAKNLGFGHVMKINLQFTDAFWKNESFTNGEDLSKLNFLFSNESIPTWWTQQPQQEALLVGWLGGPSAESFAMVAKEVLVQKALKSLEKLFSIDPALLQQKLVAAEWYNWSGDNHFCGAYSYNVVGGEAFIKTILQPVDNTVFFAGEGLCYGTDIGTVEAALSSGRNIAHQIAAQFDATVF